MKAVSDSCKIQIGHSETGYLVFVGVHPVGCFWSVSFKFDKCRDSNYMAFLLEGDADEIPPGYVRIAQFRDWMKIYDDDGLAQEFKAEQINVYRSGEGSCIIEPVYEGRRREAS